MGGDERLNLSVIQSRCKACTTQGQHIAQNSTTASLIRSCRHYYYSIASCVACAWMAYSISACYCDMPFYLSHPTIPLIKLGPASSNKI